MSFASLMKIETVEQETARLSAAPVGSKLHALSQLPVRQEIINTADIYRLPSDVRGHRITGVVTGIRRNKRTVDDNGIRLRNLSYNFMILSSDHPSYPVGGYDIIVEESELRRSEKINLD